jgi:hypothetical protein
MTKNQSREPRAPSPENGESTVLYGGKITIQRNHAHQYFVNGTPCGESMSAVERILNNEALNVWKVKEALNRVRKFLAPGTVVTEEINASIPTLGMEAPDKKRDEAADEGLALHKLLEKWIKSHLEILGTFPVTSQSVRDLLDLAKGYPDEARHALSQMGDYLVENHAEFLSSERIIYSKKLNLPGTLDCELKLNGRLTIGDFKIRSGVYENTRIQLTLEQAAASEENGKSYKDRVVFLIQRKDGKFTGTFEAIEFNDYRGDLKAAVAALKLLRWQKKHKKPWQAR